MPYPGEHSARLKDPDRYVRFRRENNYFRTGIHAIWGIMEDETVELQAIRFDADKYTVAQAKKWLRDHEFDYILFEPAAEEDSKMNRLTKYLERPFELKELEDDGIFSGYGSVFDVVDSDSEVVAKGAFKRSLAAWKKKKRMPALLWQHNSGEPVGVYTEMHEDDIGLFVQGRLAMKTARGSEAYELLQMGAISGLSIGYNVVKEEQDSETEITTLKEIDLWEVSLVTFPANDEARVQTVKSVLQAGELPTEREMEGFLRDAGFSRAQAKAILAEGYKALYQRDADEEVCKQILTETINILS